MVLNDSAGFVSDTNEEVTAWEAFLPALVQGVVGLSSSWFLHPLTLASYRWSVTNQKTLPKALTWEVIKRESSHPGRWIFTGSQGLLEACVYFFGEQIAIYFFQTYDPALWKDEALPNEDWDPLDPDLCLWTSDGVYGASLRLVSSFIGTIIARPFGLARIRILAQPPLPNGKYKYNSTWSTIWNIYRNEGLAPFIRGFVPMAICSIFQNILQSFLNSQRNFVMKRVTRYLPTENRHILALEHAFCAVLDGISLPLTALIACRPLDVISRRIDLQGSGLDVALGMSPIRYSSWIACGKAIFAEEGLHGFYKGIGFEILRDVCFLSVAIFVGDLFLNYKGIFRRVKTHTEWSSY